MEEKIKLFIIDYVSQHKNVLFFANIFVDELEEVETGNKKQFNPIPPVQKFPGLTEILNDFTFNSDMR